MKTSRFSLIILFLLSTSLAVKAQDVTDSTRLKKEQAKAPKFKTKFIFLYSSVRVE